jgi:hypothetical protein
MKFTKIKSFEKIEKLSLQSKIHSFAKYFPPPFSKIQMKNLAGKSLL